MILADTNIFLEILLEQEAKERCKQFLSENIEAIAISDFSLHSISLILFREGKHDKFNMFLEDILPMIPLLTLPKEYYLKLKDDSIANKLDFDDTYQFCTAKEKDYEIATMDKDFKRVTHLIKVHFI
jgi:predicted nucleic acid-binding protein